MDALVEAIRFLLKQTEKTSDPHVALSAGRHLRAFDEMVNDEFGDEPEVAEPEAEEPAVEGEGVKAEEPATEEGK